MTSYASTGVNLFKPAEPGLVRPPVAPAGGAPPAGPAPALDANVAPPGSPLPVGNGIAPVAPPMPVLQAAPTMTPPTGVNPTPTVPAFAPTGVNTGTFGPGNDLRSSVITAPTADRAGDIAKLQPGYTGILSTPELQAGPAVAPTAPDLANRVGALSKDYSSFLKTPELAAGPAVAPATPDLANRVGTLSKDYSSFLSTPELQAGPAVNPNEDPRLAAARAATDSSVAAVGGVDRRKAATDLLADFDRSTADSQREDYRQVGQQAASLGRLGMGQTAQDIQEVGRKHLTDRASLETRLAAETTAAEANDRLAKAGLARGVEGDIFGQGAASRGELRTERGYAGDIAAQNRATGLDVKKTGLNLATDVGTRSLADEAAARGELRTERGNVQDIAAQNRAAMERANSAALGTATDVGSRSLVDEAAARGELRTERGNVQDIAAQNRAAAERAAAGGLGTAQDVTGAAIADEQAQAAALRGERGYQFGAAETATDRAVQQAQLEEAIRNGQFERGTTLASLGYSGSPAGAQLGQANIDQEAAGGDMASIAELLKRYGYNSATKAAA